MHIVREILIVIIKPVQLTYHVIIHMPTIMIIHAKKPKENVETITWRVKWDGGGKT